MLPPTTVSTFMIACLVGGCKSWKVCGTGSWYWFACFHGSDYLFHYFIVCNHECFQLLVCALNFLSSALVTAARISPVVVASLSMLGNATVAFAWPKHVALALQSSPFTFILAHSFLTNFLRLGHILSISAFCQLIIHLFKVGTLLEDNKCLITPLIVTGQDAHFSELLGCMHDDWHSSLGVQLVSMVDDALETYLLYNTFQHCHTILVNKWSWPSQSYQSTPFFSFWRMTPACPW